MPYALEQYVDLITTTLRELERTEWADIVVDLQEHICLPYLLKKKRVEFGSGYGYQFNVRVGTNSPAQNVLVNAVDAPTTADMFVVGTGNYRITNTYWLVNEIEIDANRSPARLVNLMQGKRVDAMTSLADKMEDNFWGKPTDSTDVLTPRGVQYWIVSNASNGFNGGIPTGFSDVAGISPTTYPRWKNYTGRYVTMNKTDGIRKIRRAMTKTNFRPPVPYPSSVGESYDKTGYEPNRFMLYSTYGTDASPGTIPTCEEILESQNDDLGNDVASRDGEVTIRRCPLRWAPWLDANTSTNPVYGFDWNTWMIYFLEGNYMKETDVKPYPFNHRTYCQYTDLVYDFVCKDRRKNFIVDTA